MNDQPQEFYGSVQIQPESDPATDPLLTVRMQPPNTWLRRYDGNTPRAVKAGDGALTDWVVIDPEGRVEDYSMDNEQVADWSVQHPLVWGVAYDRLAGKAVPPPAPVAQLEGDMGVESFRG